MAINPLSSSLVNLLSEERIAHIDNNGENTSGVNFSDILTQSMDTASQADTADKISALELLTGQEDDFSGLTLAGTKAELSLQLAIQLKNKVVDAYNEIMRTQV